MKTVVAGVDRLIAIVAGTVLIAGGGFALAWRHGTPWAKRAMSTVHRADLAHLPEHVWWVGSLAAAALVAAVAGSALLIANLSPRRTGTASVIERPHFSAHVDLSAIAAGVAVQLAQFPGVRRARGTAIEDRGRPTVAVAVHAAAELDVVAFTAAARAHAATVTGSLGGAHACTRVQLHIDKRR